MPKDASVYPRKGRPNFFCSYYCPEKMKRLHVTTPWRVDDPTGHKHALRFADEKSRAAAAFHGVSKIEVWGSWVVKFLEERYRGDARAKTLVRYKNAWDWLRVYFETAGIFHPKALDYNKVLKYVEWRTKQQRHCGKLITRNTALVEVKVLGVIMREAIRRQYATVNPCERLGINRDPVAEKPEMTDAQIALSFQLLAIKEGHLPLKDRWMTISLRIALHHGTRISECQIPMSSIDLVAGTVKIVAKGRNGQAKIFTNKIHPALIPLFTELQQAGATHTCVLPKMASKHWHTFFKGPDAPAELRNLCFHCTRVTVVTRLARAGVPEQQAMRYVGHASRIVHQIYQRLKAEDMTAAQAALSYS